MDKTTQARLLRIGAETELANLQSRIKELEAIIRSNGVRGLPPLRMAPQRRRRKMSAAARKAVSIRMKRYWAERRKS
jgi:hypothetical protein